MPAFDAVLLSHYHGDHFDWLVERDLAPQTPIITTGYAKRALENKGFTAVRALRTREALTLSRATQTIAITALPGRHGPAVVANALPPVMGGMIEVPRDADIFRMYVSGDTMVHRALREIPRRFPYIDVALIHLGGTQAHYT